MYKPRDLSYLRSSQSKSSWDAYSPTARLYNTKRLVIRLQAVYDKIISQNFPQISRQLAFVKPGHRLVYVYDSSQNLGGSHLPQGATAYEIVVDTAQRNARPRFLLAEEHTIDTTFRDSRQLLRVDGEEYQLVTTFYGIGADYWKSDTSLLDTIYRYLKRALEVYLTR